MSNDAPQINPKYKQPINGANIRPKLEPSALVAFRGLFWVGLIITAIAVLVFLIGPVAIASAGFQLGVPLLAAAGVVAGLGKRETHDTTTS